MVNHKIMVNHKQKKRGADYTLRFFYILFYTMKLIPLFARLYSEPAV